MSRKNHLVNASCWRDNRKHVKKTFSKTRPGDIIIEGGNFYYKDSIRRAEEFQKNEIGYLDCGTSGGIEGNDIKPA
ncbi:NAD(P)-binding domain-containing protein [Enterococcus faecium]|nr:NAD(P)-binding domain-containing protein [Enterococcus faecium]